MRTSTNTAVALGASMAPVSSRRRTWNVRVPAVTKVREVRLPPSTSSNGSGPAMTR